MSRDNVKFSVSRCYLVSLLLVNLPLKIMLHENLCDLTCILISAQYVSDHTMKVIKH